MKITKETLKQIIKEEIENLKEGEQEDAELGKILTRMVNKFVSGPHLMTREEAIDAVRKVINTKLKQIIKEEKQKILVEYSDYPSWDDLQHSMDDITDMLDNLAAKYVTSGWLFQPENEISSEWASAGELLEQLYTDAEKLGALIALARRRKKEIK